MPLGSTALPRSLPGRIAREVEWEEASDSHGDQNPVDQEAKHSKTKESQQPSITIDEHADYFLAVL
ncbi:MAG: hypothetical protein RQ885_05235 [Desulfurococcales archaeon]|nr:hypothetical protein [Desulfurococcales archaeon]